MLAALSIRDIVLVDKLDLTLDRGLCALTGETGAGKSILLDALGLALGARADAGLVGLKSDQGAVAAVFDVAASHPARRILEADGLDAEGDLILRRVQTRDGRTRAFINDQPVSIGLLRAVGDTLVEIHGQHDERGLLDASGHRALLDAFGGLEKQVAAVRGKWDAAVAADRALADAVAAQKKARAESDYLIHSVAELTTLDPQPGEETALADERTLMMHAEKIAADLQDAQAAISSDNGLESRLNLALRKLDRAAENADGRLDAAIAALDRTLVEAAEARDALERAAGALEFDAGRLDAAESRLFALRAAARKYQVPVDELAALRVRLSGELDLIESGDARLTELSAAHAAARDAYLAAARRLSKARHAAAKKLDGAVARELGPLKLDKATFHTQVEADPEDAGGPEGLDRVAFLVSTNPGAPLGPLAKIASGGELSRFVLALKVALHARGTAPTLIFDEVDAGVGGAVAEAVGVRLAELACTAQVVVVTHSPQVAARARHHLLISKNPLEKAAKKAARLSTQVETLDERARREEIARMLAGAQVTDEARAAADRLIRSGP